MTDYARCIGRFCDMDDYSLGNLLLTKSTSPSPSIGLVRDEPLPATEGKGEDYCHRSPCKPWDKLG